LTGW